MPVVDPVAVPEATAAVDEVAALAAGLLELLALDELLPHAATSSAVAPAATVTANEVCLTFSPLDQFSDAQARQASEHRLPGDYFVSVS